MSLDDKKMDLRRTTINNLKVLIIDEISMVPVDMLYMLYMLNLRLKEIKEKTDLPFGGVAVYVLVTCYSSHLSNFHSKNNVKLAHALWETFDVIKLTQNHRQGEEYLVIFLTE